MKTSNKRKNQFRNGRIRNFPCKKMHFGICHESEAGAWLVLNIWANMRLVVFIEVVLI